MAENVEFDIIFKDLFSKTTAKLKQDLQGIQGQTDKTNKGLSTWGVAMGSMFGGLATQAVGGIMDLGKGILKLGMDAEQTQTSFEVLMGGTQKATEHLSDLKKMAAQTPFELEHLTDASKLLQNFGVSGEKVIPMLSMLGDASGGNAERFKSLSLAFAQVQAAGKLTGQDLLQMVNAGFNPLQIMSEKSGKSMAELKEAMSDGAISADMVTKAFMDVTSEGGRLYGMMDKQSKTVAGRLSTLIDNIKEVGRQIAEVLLPAVGWLIDNFKTIAKVIGVAVAAFAIYKISMFAATLSTVSFSTAFATLNAVMAANPIGLIVVALAALTAAFIWLWDTSEGFRSTLYGIWEATKQVGLNIWEYLHKPIQAVAQIWQGFQDMFNGKGLDNLINGFKALGRTLLDYLLQPLLQIIKLIDKAAGTDYAKQFKGITGMQTDLTAGTGSAFDVGYKKGLDSMKKTSDALQIDKSKALGGSVAGLDALGKGGAGGKDSMKNEIDKIQSRQPSNVYINIDAIIKGDVNNMISNANNPQADLNNFLTNLENALLTVINDVNYVVK